MIFDGILSTFRNIGAGVKNSDYKAENLDVPLNKKKEGILIEKYGDLKNILRELDRPLKQETISETKQIEVYEASDREWIKKGNEKLKYDENGTRDLTDKEKLVLEDKLEWPNKKSENCRIDKDGHIHLKTDCQDKEGTTSDCGVRYERKTIDYKGVKIEGVFPVFDSIFDTVLDESDYQSSSGKQFNVCNGNLKGAIEKDSRLRKQFTEEQLEDIENGRTPRGYTWHHSEEPGKMQLVKTEDHDRRIGGAAHTGGNSIWGNKSVEKQSGADGQKGESF